MVIFLFVTSYQMLMWRHIDHFYDVTRLSMAARVACGQKNSVRQNCKYSCLIMTWEKLCSGNSNDSSVTKVVSWNWMLNPALLMCRPPTEVVHY